MLAKAFRDDADMHVAIKKTHAMIIRERVKTSEITELDYEHDSLTHQCKSCARRFDSWDGLNTHRTLHCGVYRLKVAEPKVAEPKVAQTKGCQTKVAKPNCGPSALRGFLTGTTGT